MRRVAHETVGVVLGNGQKGNFDLHLKVLADLHNAAPVFAHLVGDRSAKLHSALVAFHVQREAMRVEALTKEFPVEFLQKLVQKADE